MTKRLPALAMGALFAVSIAAFANSASAMPAGGARTLKSAAPMNIETVQYRGRGWRGGGWRGGYRGRGWRGGGWGAGVGAGLLGGAIIGGMLAAPYYYGPGYYSPGYYGPVYGGGDAVGYCMQRFKSYDPGSGTYLGYDGLRHPCP